MNKRHKDSSIQPSDATPKRSCLNPLAKPIPGTWQSAHIKDKTPASINVIRSISSSPSIPKSHIHIVTVLANLNIGCDNSGPDQPLPLKKAMISLYWKDFKKLIYIEFLSLIENDTWDYQDVLSSRAVLTDRWVFNIRKGK